MVVAEVMCVDNRLRTDPPIGFNSVGVVPPPPNPKTGGGGRRDPVYEMCSLLCNFEHSTLYEV